MERRSVWTAIATCLAAGAAACLVPGVLGRQVVLEVAGSILVASTILVFTSLLTGWPFATLSTRESPRSDARSGPARFSPDVRSTPAAGVPENFRPSPATWSGPLGPGGASESSQLPGAELVGPPAQSGGALLRLATDARGLDALPIDPSIQITRVGFGHGVREVSRPACQSLPAELRISEALRADDDFLILADLITEAELEMVLTDQRYWLPREAMFEVHTVTEKSATSVLGLLVATNYVYPQSAVRTAHSVCLPGLFGRGGIADFVHSDGSYQTDVPLIVGNPESRLGSLAFASVVLLEDDYPVARTAYYPFVRRGIRYPDDIWWHPASGAVLANSADVSNARIAFESKRPNGPGRDIFVCDFDGERQVDATRKDEIVSSTIMERVGVAFRWISDTEFECGEMVRGKSTIRRYRDPMAAN
jgi:hypothetical protein